MLFRWSSYCPLDHVPNELWDKIFDLMHTCDLSLLSVHRTCRRFCELTKPYIYRYVKFEERLHRLTQDSWKGDRLAGDVYWVGDPDKKVSALEKSSTEALGYRRSMTWIGPWFRPSSLLEKMPNLTSLICEGLELRSLVRLSEADSQLRRLRLSGCYISDRLPSRSTDGFIPLSTLRELEIDHTLWDKIPEQMRRRICDSLTSPLLESLHMNTRSGDEFFLLLQEMHHSLTSHGARLTSLSIHSGFITEREQNTLSAFLQSQPTLRSFSFSYGWAKELPHAISLPELRFLKIGSRSCLWNQESLTRFARSLFGSRTVDSNEGPLTEQSIQDDNVQSFLNKFGSAGLRLAEEFEVTMSPSFSVVTELMIRSSSRQLHKDFIPNRLAEHLRPFSSLRKLRFLPPEESPHDTESSVRLSLLWLKDAVEVLGRACPSLRTIELGNGIEWVRVDRDEWAGYRPRVANSRTSHGWADAEEKVSFGLMGMLASWARG